MENLWFPRENLGFPMIFFWKFGVSTRKIVVSTNILGFPIKNMGKIWGFQSKFSEIWDFQ